MNAREKRIRHGELWTVAWNPSIKAEPYAILSVNGVDLPLEQLRIDADLSDALRETLATRARIFRAGELRLIASTDNTRHGRLLHVSVSKESELPSWYEMIAIKRHFYPDDVAAVMVAPEETEYVNIHEFTLHWWQLPVKWSMQ